MTRPFTFKCRLFGLTSHMCRRARWIPLVLFLAVTAAFAQNGQNGNYPDTWLEAFAAQTWDSRRDSRRRST